MNTTPKPSVTMGFRLAASLHWLVATVWVAWLALTVPALVVVQMSAGQARANTPAGGFGAGEDLLVFFEIMRPVAVPLALALAFGAVLLFGWCVLWHAGVARWWLDPETDPEEPNVAQILASGLLVWWRYARLTFFALVLQAIVAVSLWFPVRAEFAPGFVVPWLKVGSVLAAVATVLIWIATFRGGWFLGEPDRSSALVAWFRGLGAAGRQPLRSLLPLIVWAVPGLGALVAPVFYGGPAAVLFFMASWLLGAFCVVALYMSYAPPKPPRKRPISPLEPPGIG
jgi:hypothetical protein